MSYFVLVSGEVLVQIAVQSGCLVPVAQTQPYLGQIVDRLKGTASSPSYLWDDLESGTSHDLVCEAEEQIQNGASPDSTALGALTVACERHGLTVRVWWASSNPNAPFLIPTVCNAKDALRMLGELSSKGASVAYVMQPKSGLNRTEVKSKSRRRP